MKEAGQIFLELPIARKSVDMESVSCFFAVFSPDQMALVIDALNSQDEHTIARSLRYPLSLEPGSIAERLNTRIQSVCGRIER